MFSKDSQNILGHTTLGKSNDIRGDAVVVGNALVKPVRQTALPAFDAR